ncbi:MAG: MacB-like periplasmic core domain protein [Firmicutes bacterium ADurb.Bin099]|nr:MAG: MacB-like periplasmic core domain protein [Firmicutes bacterium ADurb.Bin099]
MIYSFKSFFRTPIRSIIYILLLAIAATSLCTSLAMWKYSAESVEHVQDTFTTIGVLSELEFMEQTDTRSLPPQYDYSMLAEVKKKAMESKYVTSYDIREYVMGYNENIHADVKQGFYENTYPYSLSIVTGVCESMQWNKATVGYKAILKIDYNDLNIIPAYIKRFGNPQSVEIAGTYMTADNKSPFKVGEKYIVYLMCHEYYPSHKNINGRVDKSGEDFYKYEEMVEYSSATMKEEFGEFKEGKPFYKVTNPDLHTVQMIETTAYDFIEKEQGIWAKRVEKCKITQHSAELVLTNSMKSILMFNTNDAYIVVGRNITDEEYESGANVCIVSASFASKNNLSIGDKLSFNVYENDFLPYGIMLKKGTPGVSGFLNVEGKDRIDVWLSKGFNPDRGFVGEVEYEIIGTFSTRDIVNRNEFTINNNTVFVPQKSIEGDFNTRPTVHTIKRYTDKLRHTELLRTSIPGCFSVIIENGYADAFEKEMEAAGYGGIFYYFDQNYSEVKKVLDEYNNTSRLIALISLLAWVTVVAVFLTVYASKSRRDIAIMRSLGTSQAKTYISQLVIIVLIVLIAAIICSIVASRIYDNITATAFEEVSKSSKLVGGLLSVTEKSKGTVITTAVAQFFVIVITFALIMLIQIKRNIMVLMKKAKKQ